MQSRLKDFNATEARILAISADSVENNAKASQKFGFEFPVLSDSDLTVTEAYSLLHHGADIDGGDIARPAVFVIDREGITQWQDLTDNWRVRVRAETVLEQLSKIL